MLERTQQALRDLPAYISSPSGWHSVRAETKVPNLERMWRPWRDGWRLNLNILYKPKPKRGEKAQRPFYHGHPWEEFEVYVVWGSCEEWIGMGDPDDPGSHTMIHHNVHVAGSNYAMVCDPRSGHSVMPVGDFCVSVMLNAPPRRLERSILSNTATGVLTPAEMEIMLGKYRGALRA